MKTIRIDFWVDEEMIKAIIFDALLFRESHSTGERLSKKWCDSQLKNHYIAFGGSQYDDSIHYHDVCAPENQEIDQLTNELYQKYYNK